MKNQLIIKALILSHTVFSQMAFANSDAVKQIMDELAGQSAGTANAGNGKALWNRTYSGNAPFTERSCTTCHGAKLNVQGRHVKTGKPVPPLAPSVNADSLKDSRKVKKWLLRNCKWTLGRECSAQEKADLLSFISQQ